MTQLPKGLDPKTVKPEVLFREQAYEVKPIERSDNQEMIENSKKLILKSAVSYPYEKRIMQVLQFFLNYSRQADFEKRCFHLFKATFHKCGELF
jgi:hypothetical protein